MNIGHARVIVPLHERAVIFSLSIVIFQGELHVALWIERSRTAQRGAEMIARMHFESSITQEDGGGISASVCQDNWRVGGQAFSRRIYHHCIAARTICIRGRTSRQMLS